MASVCPLTSLLCCPWPPASVFPQPSPPSSTRRLVLSLHLPAITISPSRPFFFCHLVPWPLSLSLYLAMPAIFSPHHPGEASRKGCRRARAGLAVKRCARGPNDQ